ncbi:OsmC family protein [Williamsia sp. SKLECPSW1]
MSGEIHRFDVDVRWTGNRGDGTVSYTSYGRDHEIGASETPLILGTASPAFRGDPARWNPEQLLVAALSQCHMLWYLHLASSEGVVVAAYRDHAHGLLAFDDTGGGRFEAVTLRPHVTISSNSDIEVARHLHSTVPRFCFIARSVNFAVHHEPTIVADDKWAR